MSASPRFAAIRGAVGFLSTLPFGRDDRAWDAFRDQPATFPIAGYVIGMLLVPVVVLPFPVPTVAVAFVVWVYVLTGINHVDGLADLGDAMVVHGDSQDRLAVMSDTMTGVGGVLAVALAVAGLALAGLALAQSPPRVAGVVIVAEVGAKLGMAAVVCLGAAVHEGLGSQLTERVRPRSLAIPVLVAVPSVLVTWPHPAAAVALMAGVGGAVAIFGWARWHLGGVNGDVIGASNEVGRVVALHAGVIAWTHF